MGFVFFDTETTGLKRGFDQILHFAAILTDAELNEVERFEIRSRLLPHVTPHPAAILTNGLSMGRLTDPGMPSHFEMVCTIRRQLLKWSPAIFVGYNSIRFDEEMLRNALFQSLHPAYLTSNHGNGRADAMALVMTAATALPSSLATTPGPEGRPTFRLGPMALTNGVAHIQAHDAMGDVLATLGLCRLVQQRAPELWQRFVRFSKKATVADFVEAEDGFVLTEFFGAQAYHTPVTCLGAEPGQPNGRLCLDLRVDLDRLAGLTAEALRAELDRKPCPVRRLRTNAAPAIVELWDAPPSMLGDLRLDVAEARAQRMKQDAAFRARLVSAFAAGAQPWPPSVHLEEQIYDGFPSQADEHLCFEFHDADWGGRALIVERLEDQRLKLFGRRLVYVERRSALSAELRAEMDVSMSAHLLEERGGALTLASALRETTRLIAEDGASTGILLEYRDHLADRFERTRQFHAERAAGSAERSTSA